jgi:hypothetical protein
MQLLSELAAKLVEYLPCTQSRQLVSEIAGNVIEYLTCAQEKQLASELAAKVVEYLPCNIDFSLRQVRFERFQALCSLL